MASQKPILRKVASLLNPFTRESYLDAVCILVGRSIPSPFEWKFVTSTDLKPSVDVTNSHSNYTNSSPGGGVHTSPTANTSFHSHDASSDLQTALNREQGLRKAAESQLSQAHSELEELTAQLFSQANEMVAQERKARAKLEERVALLEKRDGEKRKRLDRLEKAIARVERVRGLINS